MDYKDIISLPNDAAYGAANSKAHNDLTEFLGGEASDMALIDFPHNFTWISEKDKIAGCDAYWCANNRQDMRPTRLVFAFTDEHFQTVYEEDVDSGWFERFYPAQYRAFIAAGVAEALLKK